MDLVIFKVTGLLITFALTLSQFFNYSFYGYYYCIVSFNRAIGMAQVEILFETIGGWK